MHKRLSLEMGGKNAMIVLDDANLDLALDGVLWGAFGTTGQRCTATSRLIVQDGVHDEFVSRLVQRARSLKLGDGRKAGTDVGPLINQDSVAKVERHIDIGQKEGADLCGAAGQRVGLDHGISSSPRFSRASALASQWEEIFGPVLDRSRPHAGGSPGQQ
jgi:aldehyde dehydrogenase (NAD+)